MAVPMKPGYGPTLGKMLAPRWHAASPWTRRVVWACCAVLAVLVVAAVLTLLNSAYSHGGRVPFNFSYRGLYRTKPESGGYVRIERRGSGERLEYSFAVNPLVLPSYNGSASAELPIYAADYIQRLRGRYRDFVLRGEGKTRVNTVPAYDVLYTATVDGREVYGRDVLLLPERPAAREGVDIVMLTAAGANRQVDGPMEVATTGVLLKPLRSFTLG
jgi:hypothetical protein